MRVFLLAVPAALVLTACVELDMSLEVLGEDEARLTGFMQVQRQMFDMSGADTSFCREEEGGTLTLSDTHARCDFDRTGSFAEIIASDEGGDVPDDVQGEITHLGGDRVRVMLPLSSLRGSVEEMAAEPAMMAMMRQMMDGISVTFTVQGRVIESSNGRISADGTRASYNLTLDDLVVPEPTRLVDFETVVRF